MNQILMILLISLLVLVHEAGHFIAARMCGIRVTRFGIGMPIGPSWKMFKWGHTNFYLHAFLFGGYVSFADDERESQEADDSRANGASAELCEVRDGDALSIGEQDGHRNNESQGADSNKEKIDDNELLSEDSPELYENKTIAQKLFVVSAGVLMNVVFAIFLVIFCASVYHKLPTSTQNLFVSDFASNNQTLSAFDPITLSNADKSGILKGDKINKVNGIEVKSLYQLSFFAKNSKLFDDYAQGDLVEKNLANLKKLNPEIKDEIVDGQVVKLPKTLIENPLKPTKDMLVGLEKYKKDGIKLNEVQIDLRNKIYSKDKFICDKTISLNDLALALSDTYKPVEITVLRNNDEITFSNIKVGTQGVFGIILKIEEVFASTNTPKEIITKSFDYLYTTTTTMLKGLWQLITGKVSASDMHGVIAVVKIGADVIASKGLLNGLLLTAMISINLAIMNFLPIPALDGGHIMFLIIEKITGKKPSKEFGEKINNFFFMLLIVLMIAICYNDIFALITKKF